MIPVTIFLDILEDPADKEKFRRMYEKYSKLAYWVAYKRVHKHELAEECVQETFFNLARNFHKVGDVDSPETKSYVATIAEGIAIKVYRKEHRAVFVQPEDDEYLINLTAPDAEFTSERISAAELSMVMDELFTEEERVLVWMKYVYNYPVSEIARLKKTTDYFIAKKLSAAVHKLKEYLESEE